MKRSILKVLIMILILALCFSVSAPVYADNASVEMIKVKSGDTLQSLCRDRGLNYYSIKDTIMRLNGFTDAKQLDRILIGSTIALPVDPAANGTSSANTQEYKAAIASTGVTSASAGGTGDAVSYYIVVYTLKYGDTLNSVYSAWGLNYSSYATMISRLNSGIDVNNLAVGHTLFLPVVKSVSNVPVSYSIYEHIVRAGETMTSICAERGIDLNQFGSTLQLFNQGIDFNRILVGQKILYPATGTYTAPAASNPGTPAVSQSVPTQTAAPAAQKQVLQNPVLKNINELYVGYGVVINCGDYLRVRLETEGFDVYLTYTASVMDGYVPTPGDYIRCVFTPTDFLLASVTYVYNVFG